MKTQIKIDKAALLKATNQGLNFYSFVIPHLRKLDGNTCENTYNPFYPDKNPSLSIYFLKATGRWMFKDHGLSPDGKEYSGDVFNFAQLHYESEGLKLNFGQILSKMVEDLGIDPALVEDKTIRPAWEGNSEISRIARNIGFNLLPNFDRSRVDDVLPYFSQFGITRDVLCRYSVTAVKRYLFVDKNGDLEERKTPAGQLVIAYQHYNFVKMYSPEPKAFWYVGKKPKDYIFGFDQIVSRNAREDKYKRDVLIVTGGEKDVLTLTSLGYDAVCFNSETASVPENAKWPLFRWYKRIIVMYDADPTGVKRTQQIVSALQPDFDVCGFQWRPNLNEAEGKDVSDFVKLGLDIDALRTDIANCGQKQAAQENLNEQLSEDLLLTLDTPDAEEYTPNLPEKVYNDLPDFFKQLCDQFPDRRDKDVLLLSALGVVSSFFPNVCGEHNRMPVGPNLYLFISAPPASGKGVMTWSRKLGSKIQGYLRDKYAEEMREYEFELAEYNSNGHSGPKPIMPQQQSMFIPANISTSKITQFLGANGNFGVIMETEADTLAGTFKNDWGNFSDILRNAFHHEPVTSSRTSTEHKGIEVENPRLSVVLSGTFNQVNNLLDGVENGLFSRFLFYEFRSAHVWKNMFVKQDAGNSLTDLFEESGNQCLEWWKQYSRQGSCVVYLQSHQVNILNQYFERKLGQLVSDYGDYIKASITRSGLICYRIAIILTVARVLAEEKMLPDTLYATDADFECALRIIDTLLHHVQKVFSRLEDSARTSKLKAQPKSLFDALPAELTREQYDKISDGLSIKLKTAERYLDIFIKQNLLERYGQGKYRKI